MAKKKKPLLPREEIVKNVLSSFGGLHNLAAMCVISISAVCQWRTGVPSKHQQTLLQYAREHGIDFTAEDFFTVREKSSEPVKVCLLSGRTAGRSSEGHVKS